MDEKISYAFTEESDWAHKEASRKIRYFPVLIVYSLLFLWIISWTSWFEQIFDGSVHKIVARVSIFTIIALVFSSHPFMARRTHFLQFYFLIFLIWLGCTTFWSAEPLFTFSRWLDLILLWLTVWTIVALGKRYNILDTLPKLIVLMLSAYAGLLILAYFFLPEISQTPDGMSVSGVYQFRLGGYLARTDAVGALGGIIVIYGICSRRSFNLLLKISLVLIGFSALVLAYSRSAIIFTLVVLLIYFVSSKRLKFSVMFFLSVLILPAGFIFSDSLFYFITRGEASENLLSAGGRIPIFQGLLVSLTPKSLLMGHGFRMFSEMGQPFYVPYFDKIMTSAHNGYMTVLMGAGAPALMVVLFLQYSIWRRLSLLYSEGYSSFDGAGHLLIVFLSGITVFDYGIWGASGFPLFFLMLIISLSITPVGNTIRKSSRQ